MREDHYDLIGEPSAKAALLAKAGDAPKPVMRKFDTGATRDLDDSKFDFEAFLSPLVIEAYGKYMHGKRKMADGSMRDGDNWQKGIPLDAYMKSGYRHHLDWWKHHRGLPDLATEDLEDTLCALLFNVMGYLHETLKEQRQKQDASAPHWKEWGGEGLLPKGDAVVVARLRAGRETAPTKAKNLEWGHWGSPDDIVAYYFAP